LTVVTILFIEAVTKPRLNLKTKSAEIMLDNYIIHYDINIIVCWFFIYNCWIK